MIKKLISSYNKKDDTFVGKVINESGYSADYGISEGVFLGINKFNIPNSIFVSNASKVFNIPKNILEYCNITISIYCNDILSIKMCVEDFNVFSVKCDNIFGIPKLNFIFDSNYWYYYLFF